MIGIDYESYDDCINELTMLVHELWDEVGYLNDTLELNVNWSLYEDLCAQGQAAIFTMRDDDILVGFSVWVFTEHQYFMGTKVATSDCLYVKPEYRGEFSMMFIESNINTLTELGMDLVQIQMMNDHKFEGLLEHLGFDKASVTMSMHIGD